MLSRTARFVLVPVALAALAAIPAAQTQQSAASVAISPPAPEVKLTGTWRFDDDAIREDARNWRRPVNGRPVQFGPPGGGAPPERAGTGSPVAGDPTAPGPSSSRVGAPRSAGSLGEPWDSDVRRALRDLLEVTPRYTITVDPTQVTIEDDLERRFVFMTDGRKEKHRSGGTGFETRTRWDGAVLKQDIQANQFKMSQAFMLASDESAMFVWLTVDKPELVPPIKKLTRVYLRVR